MSTKRSIILRGTPEVNEYGVASEAIKPGYLVKGVTTIAKASVSNARVKASLALERDEMGAGIDDTYRGTNSGAPAAAYASGDTVKVAAFAPGMEATVYIASGQNIALDDLMGSAGNGTFKEVAAADAIAVALEAPGAVTVETALRVQFI